MGREPFIIYNTFSASACFELHFDFQGVPKCKPCVLNTNICSGDATGNYELCVMLRRTSDQLLTAAVKFETKVTVGSQFKYTFVRVGSK